MKKYYLAENAYADETSIGFANTWTVLAFSTRRARDAYLKSPRATLASRAIRRDEIRKYVDAPRPFSGERRILDTNNVVSQDHIDGYLGFIRVGYPDGPGAIAY